MSVCFPIRRVERRGIRSGVARSTFEIKQWLTLCLLIERRQDDHVQIDFSADARLAIFKNAQFATKQWFIDPLQPALSEFAQPAQRPNGFMTRGQQNKGATDRNQGGR